ncbi:MAG TPA: proton-conducting transporter membrane subunit, partial [Burkholderiales bacterium]|nr:proton-conducting transporter membrane subunit [Burkholderiales bacterium]
MIWLVAVPLTLGVAAALLGPRLAPRLALPGIVATLAVTAAGVGRIARDGPQREALGGFAAPLGIELYGDGLAALMVGTTALVAALVALYARSYLPLAEAGGRFWALSWLLWASMNALYLSADLFNLYVTLELLALSSIGLIGLRGGAVALAAALRYLLAALLGSAAYLLGVALLYGAYGTLSLAELAVSLQPGPYASLVVALVITGLALKTALFPLHFWLPPAHGAALTPVSALLSGLVVMASFYLVLRLWFDVFGAAAGPAAGQALGALGAAAIVWGALAALRQRRLKMLVAYSTVAQVGYFFLLFPMASAAAPDAALAAWTGGTLYAVSPVQA